MADKEATVYIVDVGSSMGQKNHDRDESDFDWAMRYVWDKITTTVATGRKTATVGVVGLRTDGTDNELGSEDSFEHISVIQNISQLLLPGLRDLRDKLRLSNTNSGDAISALVVAIQLITAYCKKLKYRRKIVLVTNGTGATDADDVDQIASKLRADNMELVILGVDFDDPDFGTKEKGKPPIKTANEATLKGLTEKCDGVFGTLEQAVSELGIPRVKSVRPVPSYRGRLTLGDPEKYKSAMCIDVERYPRTMVAKAPSASQFVVKTESTHGEGSAQSSATVRGDEGAPGAQTGASNLASVRNTRTYQVLDESAPGGKRDVDRERLAKGYEYGRTAVHISEADENVTKLETQASYELVGFIPREKFERYMSMSTSCVIVAQKANEKAGMALSSLVHALFELDSYGIARLVNRDDKPPVFVLLAPSIEPDYDCLLDVQLPFAEDLRSYRFPPLDKIVTVSGNVLHEHRNLPGTELNQAMSDYVDKMDLSEFGADDEGKPAEYMAMEDTFSPVLHRIDQAVRWRAVHLIEPIPPPNEILTRYSQQPQELVERSKPELDALVAASDVKKVPSKLQSRRGRGRRAQPAPLSGLDVGALLSRERPSADPSNPQSAAAAAITRDNAIPEFKQFLATTEDPNAIAAAVEQMRSITDDQITRSLGDSAYGTAVEELQVVREELIELEEPEMWNELVKGLKTRLLAGDLGGDRREMWWEVRKAGLGLVTKATSRVSEVGEDEAKTFLTSK